MKKIWRNLAQCDIKIYSGPKKIRGLQAQKLHMHMTKNFISLFERAFKLMKNGVCFVVIALVVAELFKILIYANQMTYCVTKWTQHDVKSQKMEYLWGLFPFKTETVYSCYTHLKVP